MLPQQVAQFPRLQARLLPLRKVTVKVQAARQQLHRITEELQEATILLVHDIVAMAVEIGPLVAVPRLLLRKNQVLLPIVKKTMAMLAMAHNNNFYS